GCCRVLYITHEEIANALGSAREAISRMLKELERSGKLKLKRGMVELL
ncbi:helix-turn-helix domain-containing protein, partial [Helicobacter sp.]